MKEEMKKATYDARNMLAKKLGEEETEREKELQKAFIEGYKYAIKVLNDGLIKKE